MKISLQGIARVGGAQTPYFIIFAAVLVLLISYNIVYANPLLWLGILMLLLILVMSQSNVLGLYLIAVSIFFADWLAEAQLIPGVVTLLPELIIVLYVLKSLIVKPKRINPSIFLLFVPFVISALVSILANYRDQHIVTILFGFRSLFRYVLLFYCIQVLPYTDQEVKRFIKLLLFLLVIQIPVAVVKLSIYGQGELAIGTYGESGGTYSTIFPLIGVSIFFGLYFFFRRSFWNILVCAGFLAFGVIGGKRGLIGFFPIIIVYLMLNIPKSAQFSRRALSYALLAILLGLGIWAPLTFMHSLRDDPLGYAIGYETAVYGDQATGRVSTAKLIYHHLSSGPMRFLFGFGPGSNHKTIWPEYMGRLRRDAGSYGIAYGISGFSWSALEFGYLGAVLFLIPILYLYVINRRYFKGEEDPYWKALSFGLGGIIFTSLAINMIYSDFYRLDIPAFLLFFIGGLVYRREAHGRLLSEAATPPGGLSEGSPSRDIRPRFDIPSQALRDYRRVRGE